MVSGLPLAGEPAAEVEVPAALGAELAAGAPAAAPAAAEPLVVEAEGWPLVALALEGFVAGGLAAVLGAPALAGGEVPGFAAVPPQAARMDARHRPTTATDAWLRFEAPKILISLSPNSYLLTRGVAPVYRLSKRAAFLPRMSSFWRSLMSVRSRMPATVRGYSLSKCG